jgi:tripartite-type tricarboxylate transporter receptor subunit TctC
MRSMVVLGALVSLILAACAPTAARGPAPAPAKSASEQTTPGTGTFDERAVAAFYSGKTVRIVVGYGPGGATDTISRMLQKVLSKHIPGNPNVVIENKPGGGSMLAANTVYNTEPKDGTVITIFSQQLVTQQAIRAPGVQFDAAKFNWLASTYDTVGMCAARTDSGITSIQDIMNGKELTVSSFGKGTPSYEPPAVMNAALGTNFKIVTGYQSGAAQRLAVKNGEVQGFCTSFETVAGTERDMVEGPNPLTRVIIVTGSETPSHPFLQGVPAAETLAKTDEAKNLLRAVHVSFQINLPFAAAPGVPSDRVAALRRAFERAYADPELVAIAEQAKLTIAPKTGEEVTRIVLEMLNTPPATLEKLKDILQ